MCCSWNVSTGLRRPASADDGFRLTILHLDEVMGRHATYHGLADVIPTGFTNPKPTLRELFSRIVFNICVGNTDDQARNHSAFWDGSPADLHSAYDICPQTRSGESRTVVASDDVHWGDGRRHQ